MRKWNFRLVFIPICLCIAWNLAAFAGSEPNPQAQTSPTEDWFESGIIENIEWSQDGGTLVYLRGNEKIFFNLISLSVDSSRKLTPEEEEKLKESRQSRFRRRRAAVQESEDPRFKAPGRGRQYMAEKSPDGKWNAFCENWNVVLESTQSGKKRVVTNSGDRKFRYGTANWVTGEELGVRHGMWWTPDSRKLIYCVFDERQVRDFYLVGGWSEIHTSSLVEGYTKAGDPNPIMSLEIFDLDSGTRTPVDCGECEYIYNMLFTPGGKEMLFSRTDRQFRKLEVVALDPQTCSTRVVVTENQKCWQETHPEMRFLEDGERFLWETEKSGWRHYELRHLNGQLLSTITRGEYPVAEIVHVDEQSGWIYYLANTDKENPLRSHLYRVLLNGKGTQRLTPDPLNHGNIQFSPDGKWFISRNESMDTPPSTFLYSQSGKQVFILAKGPDAANDRSEIFSFTAEDGVTRIYGVLHKPEDFDPEKKYPLILSVYGGPDSRAVNDRFVRGNRMNEGEYLVAQIDGRGTSGRSKAFKDAVYGKLGTVDIQDQADGIRSLRQRPYVDGSRVGIVGHSYGGYMALMGILKHPDVFTVSVALAAVTWYRNYDSIYTERYMNLPQENPEGYEQGNAVKFVQNLKGQLLIMHGMIDDNVHPNNVFQLTEALNEAGKHGYYETRFFPNAEHVYYGSEFQKAFFERYLMPGRRMTDDR